MRTRTAGIIQSLLRAGILSHERFGTFFFQAEDGIRESSVTEVQTCALPISSFDKMHRMLAYVAGKNELRTHQTNEIGRASCRERGEISVVAVSLKKRTR